MTDNTKIWLILLSAMLIAGAVAWSTRNADASDWQQKYETLQAKAKVDKDHADVRFAACMNQFGNIDRGRNK